MLHYITVLAFAITSVARAQDTLSVMSYNLLNFPDPNPFGKVDTLAGILAWHPVDLLIAEEIHAAAAAQLVLDEALNTSGVDRFSMAAFVPQQSAPWATIKLAQTIFYDHNKLGLRDQMLLYTDVRDINVYTLYLRDNGIFQGDTTFLTVCALHLKASNSQPDIDDRTDMAQTLWDHLATLPAGRQVIIGGDFNIYTGTEPAFTTLLAPAGDIQIADPLDLEGSNWSGSGFGDIHTQSTRVNTLFGDGAGGGLDDRFDMLLISDDMVNGGASLQMVPGSYRPLGNSGTCWNGNITGCSTLQTPYHILRKLYYMSDHLPITMRLATSAVLGVPPQVSAAPAAISITQTGRGVRISHCPSPAVLTLLDMSGRVVFQHALKHSSATTTIPLPEDLHGAFVARLVPVNSATALRIILE